MPLLLDSADRNEIEKALVLGIISGITTNPRLMYDAGVEPAQFAGELIKEMTLPVWLQVPEGEQKDMYRWAVHYWSLAPERVVIKVLCTWNGVNLIGSLSKAGVPVCMTSVFTSSQALTAFHAGADYVAPYVNRSTRRGKDGVELVQEISSVIRAGGKGNILAASLKSPEELVGAYIAGASYLTAPYWVLRDMLHSPLTEEAVEDFRSLPGGALP